MAHNPLKNGPYHQKPKISEKQKNMIYDQVTKGKILDLNNHQTFVTMAPNNSILELCMTSKLEKFTLSWSRWKLLRITLQKDITPHHFHMIQGWIYNQSNLPCVLCWDGNLISTKSILIDVCEGYFLSSYLNFTCRGQNVLCILWRARSREIFIFGWSS